ncbi:MAG: acyl--CoA ligase [Methyloceanibacter sp.]|jgi:long-chain acyl-CoA synthetase|nr:acyl--CoA ligase [Methyloceanibacter sp.]
MQGVSPYAVLQEHASRQPDAEAVVSDDATVTYSELFERVSAFASWLLQQGLIPGEATGICIPDEIGHLVCSMALLALDAPQMSLGSHENGVTKRALGRKTGITQLVVGTPETWMEGLRTIVAPVRDPKAMSAALDVTPSTVFREPALDAICVYRNTSGSTNLPKTFGLTFERLLLAAQRYADNTRVRRVLRTGSLEFDAHRLLRICSLLAGNTCVFARDVTARGIIALCQRAKVSSIHMSTYKLTSLIHRKTNGCGRLPPFTGILTGGSRVPGRLREEVKASLTENLWVLYAASETGMISLASPDQHEAFPEGVGFPAENVTVEIVDSSGGILGPGEIGEIRIRKPNIATEYAFGAGASANFRDGWFYPGDLVSQDNGAPLIFHGRADDVMILNGINIFPGAIEDTLESHPDVREAVAYPIKSRIHGEIPTAAVVLSAHARSRDTEHLLEYCRQSLGVRSPRQILSVESIPRNQAGKPLRRDLASS